jgi:ABC-type multidrug transport system fused ATPase/permease subunit
VPVLVPDPDAWCRTHHDAAVATLAAAGLLDDAALALLDAHAAAGDLALDAAPFVDDFTPEEAADAPAPQVAHRALAELVDDAMVGGPLSWIVSQLGRPAAALELVGLKDRMHHKPAELSGGQRQRVAIARALVHEPSVILADEPTGNLDSRTTDEILALLVDLNARQGRTVLVITHEPEVAGRCRRVIQLKDGRVVRDSAP